MGWIDIAWPMLGATSLTLGLVHLLVWIRRPAQHAYLLFFVTAVLVAVFTVFELRMMRAASPDVYADTLRWAHIPVLLLFTSFVGFVLLYLPAGRWWLGAAAVAVRAASLAFNFSTGVNLNWLEVSAMMPVQLWGDETIYVPVGIPNPAMILGQLSNLLLVGFVVDASIGAWRRGDPALRRRTLLVGGSLTLLPLLGTVHAALLIAGVVSIPTTLSVLFLLVVLAMAYELGSGVLEAANLADRLRRNELRLRESEQRLQLAASAGELGLWEWDLAGDAVWMTRECRALFGYTPDEPVGFQHFLTRVHREDRPALEQQVKALRTDAVDDLEQDFRIVLPGGGIRWVRSRGRIERSAAGAAVRLRGVSLDVTARKQAEAEAARRRDELAHLARVSMLGELSGSLAHELNQPLSAIVSNAQAAQRFLAREPSRPENVSEILGDIVTSGKRAGAVITRLRSLMKKEEVQHQPVDLNEAVQEVVWLMRSDLLHRRVTVHTVLAPDLPAVLGDRVQLQQVLLNLVINACDAIGEQAVAREIVVRTESALDGDVQVSVTDSGPGIPAADLQRIFEPFRTTKPQGMGLGLAVCRTIVQAHRGRLWAANGAQAGAILHVSLPAHRAVE